MEETEQVVYQTGAKPKASAKKTLIYEMFAFLGTSKYFPGRKFHRFFVCNVIPHLKTKLTDEKIEARMRGKKDDLAYEFLSSIGQIMDDIELALNRTESEEAELIMEPIANPSVLEDRDEVEPVVNEEMEKSKEKRMEELMDDDANRTMVPDVDEPEKTETRKDDEKISNKLGYNRFMRDDVWKVGKKRLEHANVKDARISARVRADRKSRINRAICDQVRTCNGREAADAKLGEVSEMQLPPFLNRIVDSFPEYFGQS